MKAICPKNRKTLRFSKNNNSIRITDIASGYYLIASLDGSNNEGFNLTAYYDSNSALIKEASDDICPIYYDYSYRCGNHGNNVVREAVVTAHGLTEADIGKVFTSSTLIKYVLVKIVDANTLWFIHDSSSHTFVTGQMASPLSDGTITLNLESNTLVQLIPSINNIKQTLTLDGAEVTENGSFDGKELIISEMYGSVDTLEMLKALKDNVGGNTNESYYANILPCDLIYSVNYKFGKSLQMIVEGKIVILRNGVNLTRWSVTQSQMIKGGRRIIVPYSADVDLITLNSNKVYDPSEWESVDFPPNKVYQFDTQSSLGFAVAYMTDYGDAEWVKRKEKCTQSAINIASTYKLYPWVIYNTDNSLDAMTEIYGVAVRQIVELSDTIVLMYRENGMLYAEIEKRTDDYVEVNVPSDFNNKLIRLIHKSGTAYIQNTSVINGKICINGSGSLSIKM